MNYQAVYDSLITKYGTWEKPKGVYTERHRKLPGWLGGKYVKGNAFYVPARVHFICHILLAKIYDSPSSWRTVVAMSGLPNIRRNSWWYASAKSKCFVQWKEHGNWLAEKYAKENGDLVYKLGIGCHARSSEKMSEDGRKGGKIRAASGELEILASKAGKKAAEIGAGCHNLESRKKGGYTQLNNKIGIHKQTLEERVALGKLGSSIRYRCLECGMESTAGNIGRHHISSGHKGRERV